MLVSIETKAQLDSIGDLKVTLNGYLETYYLYDFANPGDHLRPGFYVSHHRHNEFNLNMGIMRFSAENKKVKTAFALMAGTYVNTNLALETGVLKNIYEANVSLKLHPKSELWLQMGIFNSHIGFESAIGADCFTLTRSIAADNSPYYESGARLNYKSNNTMPSLGTQITYTASTLTFNSSNYFGNEGTDAFPIWRYFHNFYLIKKIGAKNSLIVGLDAGLQNNSVKSSTIYWYTPQLVYRYSLSKKFDIAARVEHYFDKDAAITAPLKNAKFNMLGASINLDCKIINNVLFRIEFKQLNNSDPIFTNQAKLTRYNSSIASAFTVKF